MDYDQNTVMMSRDLFLLFAVIINAIASRNSTTIKKWMKVFVIVLVV